MHTRGTDLLVMDAVGIGLETVKECLEPKPPGPNFKA